MSEHKNIQNFLEILRTQQCPQKGHKNQPYILICLDQSCKHKGQIVCSECILQYHNHNSQTLISLQNYEQYLDSYFEQTQKKQSPNKKSNRTLLENSQQNENQNENKNQQQQKSSSSKKLNEQNQNPEKKNDQQQQSFNFETPFKNLLQSFKIFKKNIIQQLEEIEKKIEFQVNSFTYHENFNLTHQQIKDLHSSFLTSPQEKQTLISEFKQKFSFFSKQFRVSQTQRQIEKIPNLQQQIEKQLEKTQPQIDIMNQQFLQLIQSYIQLNKMAKFEDFEKQHKFQQSMKDRQLCRFQNSIDGDWGINAKTFIRLGFYLKDPNANASLLGLKQNKISRWKQNQQIDIRIIIFKGKIFGQNLIFDETFSILKMNQNMDESNQFYDLMFSRPVKIEGNQQYIIAQLHQQSFFSFCGGGRKSENMIPDFNFFDIKEVQNFENHEPQPMHDLFEFGLLHTFFYRFDPK
ncbi:hypothetical protein PPERSA_09698 [Pseudocohnilembus persalinus]|uniref:PHR domain-containing protein n=1 Tax=Pseudocohnilembus persalinus TaxID=266149 RepID=A0A0V0QV90_PSEPJ|nr:hypothetical protein PPERSA_09698 [Pseudocohnilembus persalinus]|eukprot:KRX06086.1 hypothetical protein PPERSA_09698 [Pseudocohnilembus persalinus]